MKFNRTTETAVEQSRTTNMEGGEAFESSDRRKRLSMVVINNLLEDSFYESDSDSLEKVIRRFEACARTDPEFTMQLAAWTREEAYIRQVPQILLVLAANHRATKEYVDQYADLVIQRADEPLEALAMQVSLEESDIPQPSEWKVDGQGSLFGKSIPRPLTRALEDALHSFDEYQFAKYDRSSREFQYRDLMNLVHPTPRDEEHEELFERIAYGDLDDYPNVEPLTQHRTWENRSSSDEYDEDAAMWRDTLPEMGLFAKIRNVRNMLDAGLEEEEILTDEDLARVDGSSILPFRFYQAYDASQTGQHLDEWFERAIDIAVSNTPDELADTYAGVDLSGSMDSTISNHSTMRRVDISSLFGAVCHARGAGVGGFGSGFSDVDLHSGTPVLQAMQRIAQQDVGHSTNGHLVIEYLINNDLDYDTIVLFTDEEIWNSQWHSSASVKDAWDEYVSSVNGDASLYIVNLAAYGDGMTMPEEYHNVYHISGWNDALLDHISYASGNDSLMVQEIQSIGE